MDQLKEFQQKSSPVSVGGEKVAGGAGAKKKRKVKGPSHQDATSTDRSSPDNVSPSSFHVFACLSLHTSTNDSLSLCKTVWPLSPLAFKSTL